MVLPRKNYKRPGYRRCAKMVMGDARKALVLARKVKGMLNVEVKNFDTQQTAIALTNSMVITQLTNIGRGDTTNERDGSQCKMIGINLNYLLVVSANNPRTSVRILLVLDKQTNQAIYSIGDLIQDTSASDNIISPRNLDNKHRFSILYDRVHHMSTSLTTITVKKYIRRSILLRYDDSSDPPDITDLTQNSLSLVQVTNESTNVPTLTSFVRVRYVDN